MARKKTKEADGMPDYLELYWLESYLFNRVSPLFRQDHRLSAFDFFCIIIWKSNRATTGIKKGILTQEGETLDEKASALTQRIYAAADHKSRMQILLNVKGIGLPIASAILTVLYPDDFTIYDKRVCQTLNELDAGKFDNVKNRVFDGLWTGYQNYINAVREQQPQLTLRDKDRYLWGRSFAKDLEKLSLLTHPCHPSVP